MPKKKSRVCVWYHRYYELQKTWFYDVNCRPKNNTWSGKDLKKYFKFCPYCGRKIRIKESKENA